jgi:predicted DNA helicase
MNEHLQQLLACIDLEQKAQEAKYGSKSGISFKELKKQGLLIHPLRITNRSYGFADYPECTFTIPYPSENNLFKAGIPIQLVHTGVEPVKGMLLFMDTNSGSFRLHSSEFPDWLEERGTAIQLAPDIRTFKQMRKAVEAIEEHPVSIKLFERIHGIERVNKTEKKGPIPIDKWQNEQLNQSQQEAIHAMVNNDDLRLIHGPPGTGKTTTLVEGIVQLVNNNKRILVSAPSNSAVDHLVRKTVAAGLHVLRSGNQTKVSDDLFPWTVEGPLAHSPDLKEIKKLRKQADELRRMASRYKRNFGKEERDQKRLILQEVKNLQQRIRELDTYQREKLAEKTAVLLGTPVGLLDELHQTKQPYDVLIIDEAGQCLEPFFWMLFPFVKTVVLAGDHLQLPPTVLSDQAQKMGLGTSILERCFNKGLAEAFLDTQYRMPEALISFSNDFFYQGKLKSAEKGNNEGGLFFYDTAGTGFEEERDDESSSTYNSGELGLVEKLIEFHQMNRQRCVFISPYAAQIMQAKSHLTTGLKISTIDAFQGQESPCVILSLVRSNELGQLGFLKEYRRMNVAMTRAQELLIVIGDSATLSNDSFYTAFLEKAEALGGYRSAWEVMG